MDIQSVKKVVGKLKSNLFKNSNSYSIGMLRSHFRGTGLQFKEHQVYRHGDDIRFIDWKVLARTNVPYIKTFEEERNVEIAVVLDVGPSMLSGFEGISKLQASIEICCLLYLLSQETGDYVYTTIVSKDITHVPKGSGERGIIQFISILERQKIIDEHGNINLLYQDRRSVDEETRMKSILKHLAKRRELVLLSDFYDFFDVDSLKRILFRSHVHCFQILSPLDEAQWAPFALHVSEDTSYSKGKMCTVNFSTEQQLIKVLGKRFKKLKVHGRYLEEFVKEMM
ncbi:MAG: DUF58 domain-containing protein [Bacteriovoracaceae bacterium]|nr:DUF58 domain-containing protein [Bacteriovoracaceae bacterium]